MSNFLKWIIVGCISLIGLLLIGHFIFTEIFSVSLNGPLYPDFTGYENKAPLLGATVQSRSLTKVPSYFSAEKWQFTQKYSSGFGLVEYKEDGEESSSCKDQTDRSNSSNSFSYTCRDFTLKDGSKGSVTTTYIGEKVEDVHVVASIHGTRLIFYDIPEEKQKELADYAEWEQYFDAMEPVDLCKIDSKDSKSCFLRDMSAR